MRASINAMGTFVLGVRVLLAAVFAVAGVAKLRDEFGTRDALYQFDVPPKSIGFLWIALPVTELVTAVALLFPPTARLGAVLALLLLAAFVFVIARALSRGKTPDCHCFGQLHSSPAGPTTLVRNGVLAALAVVVLVEGPGPSISSWVGDRSAEELVAVGAGILAVLSTGSAIGLWADKPAAADASQGRRRGAGRASGWTAGRVGRPFILCAGPGR